MNNNPYNYNMPVTPEMFYGRQADVDGLVTAVRSAPGDSIALIAGRRMGKTSLLEAIMRELESSPTDEPLLCVPLFLDLSGVSINSTADFFHQIAEEAIFALSAYVDDPIESFPLESKRPVALIFRHLLTQWSKAIMATQGRLLRLVLLLDECEQIVARSWSGDLYGGLRSLLVGPSTRTLMKVVMTGSHRFLMQVYQNISPLSNILVYHKLAVLDDMAVHNLITRPTKGELNSDIVKLIKHQSGGHPFLTQYLMYHVCLVGLTKATPDSIIQLVTDFSHQRNDFWSWTAGLGKTGRQLYAALSERNAPVTEVEMRSMLNPLPPDLLQAIDALCYHGLATRNPEKQAYHLTGEMFRQWFHDNGNVPDKQSLAKHLPRLRHLIAQHFSIEEIQNMCFDLSVEYENLPGTTRNDKAREVVSYCVRTGMLDELFLFCRQWRPQVDWG